MNRFKKTLRPSLAPDNEGADSAAVPGGTGAAAVAPPAATDPATPPAPGGRGAKVVTMKRETLARQVKEAGARARAEERAALEKRARALGYKSLEDMLKKPSAAPARAAASPAGNPAAAASVDPNQRKHERELERLRRNAAAERAARIAAQRLKKQAELDRDALDAERALERIAVRSGVVDVDYAIHLYAQHCDGKTEAELAALDEVAFFGGLKATNPYIFGERPVTQTAATTVAIGTTPAAPGTKPTVVAGTTQDKFDARKATKEEVEARAKKYGIRMPGTG